MEQEHLLSRLRPWGTMSFPSHAHSLTTLSHSGFSHKGEGHGNAFVYGLCTQGGCGETQKSL